SSHHHNNYNNPNSNNIPFVYKPNTNYKPTGPLPSKLLKPERDFLYNNGGCYKCRKLGHLGPKCRIFPSTPQQFHNIETQQASPSSQPGKANSN
ncbi:hypothetical protein BGZ95_008090, partial [Linnemannia exigua]